MSDKGSQEELSLRRLPDGGYVVIQSQLRVEVFAATRIDDALDYIRQQVEPVSPCRPPPREPAKYERLKGWQL